MRQNRLIGLFGAILVALVMVPGVAQASTFFDYDDPPCCANFGERDLTTRYPGVTFTTVSNLADSSIFASVLANVVAPTGPTTTRVSRQTSPFGDLMAVSGSAEGSRGDHWILLTFADAVKSFRTRGIDYYGGGDAPGDEDNDLDDEDMTITAYDASGVIVFQNTFVTSAQSSGNAAVPTGVWGGFNGLDLNPATYVLFEYHDTTGGFGMNNSSFKTINDVPEPVTLSLIGMGLLGLAWVRRKA